MGRPFGYPIFYHDKVQRKLVELEATSKTDEELSALEDLRCYTELMDGIMAFYNGFATLSASDDFKVQFDDLWHLFKPGETIFYPEATSNPCASDCAKLKRSKSPDQKLWRVYARMYKSPGIFTLQDRRFVSVSVANLNPIEESSSRFQDLIIDASHERMPRALVRSHFARKELRDSTGVQITNQDTIQNKRKGLVILLHGVPGVGKAYTAEAMAIEFSKPLLPMTCGDLGLDPEAVEDSLKELFRLAQKWDCILLLDEADVFLTERIPSDLRRNALVSVSLRVLDYYSGVLFLTTNRVGTMTKPSNRAST
ncbi:hypothetical protein BDW59DRAFT_162513 [Aspergillus cavernicola]|uniref:AAA+ ATPase domain-containing protein n=1 Tax=Aspergillus cavernicola TaxID=176166 RepID=A0ABR4I9I3_9EURO